MSFHCLTQDCFGLLIDCSHCAAQSHQYGGMCGPLCKVRGWCRMSAVMRAVNGACGFTWWSLPVSVDAACSNPGTSAAVACITSWLCHSVPRPTTPAGSSKTVCPPLQPLTSPIRYCVRPTLCASLCAIWTVVVHWTTCDRWTHRACTGEQHLQPATWLAWAGPFHW